MKSIALAVGNLFIGSMMIAACANGPCRPLRQPQRAETQASSQATANNTKAPGTSSAPAPAATPSTLRTAPTGASTGGPVANSSTGRVFVYKADGSLQCGMGKAISAGDMEKELKHIEVFSREKRSDGLMHIQVCGSPTGMINVYEISAGQLSQAEALGFKRLER